MYCEAIQRNVLYFLMHCFRAGIYFRLILLATPLTLHGEWRRLVRFLSLVVGVSGKIPLGLFVTSEMFHHRKVT